MDFLFHKVSEQEKQKIKEQVKSLIEDFSKKLSRIDSKEKEPIIERKECERTEGKNLDATFSRKIMFENAPEKNKDSIIAEKGEWK